MKNIQKLSFRTQIFLASLLMVILPSVVMGLFSVRESTSEMEEEYRSSSTAMLSQASMTLDSLIQDAVKVADMPILSEDVRRAMITDYGNDYLSYAQVSTLFRDLFNQTNRLNTSLVTCVFTNRYGYTFEYNTGTSQHQHQIEENVALWAAAARTSSNFTFFAPPQASLQAGGAQEVLPMVKILRDKYSYEETGTCYCEIDFSAIREYLSSAEGTIGALLIYNADAELIYAPEENSDIAELMPALSDFARSLEADGSITETTLMLRLQDLHVSGIVNETTNWRIIQLTDGQFFSDMYRGIVLRYVQILLMCIVLGLILSLLLSSTLTRSISRLCRSMDAAQTPDQPYEEDEWANLNLASYGSNRELRQLIRSFESLYRRLGESMRQSYAVQLAEQQTRIQMLQFQINHHFLYNTLNLISSLANIHNVPEISTISVNMSEMLRYSLRSFPFARLEEELRQTERYMTIQSIRFPDKFIFEYDIPPGLLSREVPSFLLQPLVENSVIHGFASREADCLISITCGREGEHLHLYVTDNGDGMDENTLRSLNGLLRGSSPDSMTPGAVDTAPSAGSRAPGDKTDAAHRHRSIGLQNVHQRIQSHYGPSCGLNIESVEHEGTIVDISLPMHAGDTLSGGMPAGGADETG